MMEQKNSLDGINASLLIVLAKVGAWFALALGLLLAPIFGVKIGAVSLGVSGFLFCAYALPFHQSLMLFFLYLLFDGCLKILSGYHPIVHVGQDLYLIALALRVVLSGQWNFSSWKETPFLPLFLLFFCSVFVQYLNPFGLGILPSLAGTKVYLSGILLFFLVYHHLRSPHIRSFCLWIVALGLLETVIATVEYLYFPEKIFLLHPKYRAIAGARFVGDLYRPFGTTPAPGGPSIWVFLCAPFAYYLIAEVKLWKAKLLGLAFFFFGFLTLLFCQTRSAMLLSALALVVAMLAPNGRRLPKFILFFILAGGALIFFHPDAFFDFAARHLHKSGLETQKADALHQRLRTLASKDTYTQSRQGALARISQLGSVMPYGIGLSRVGAASAVWQSTINDDKEFGPEWSFTDNVYLAIFTELGFFGLLSWMALTVSIALSIVRKSWNSKVGKRRSFLWICGVVPLVILLGGWGSEGILYMPVGAFFWTSLAFGLRESRYV